MKKIIILATVAVALIIILAITYSIRAKGRVIYPEVTLLNLKSIEPSEFRRDQIYISIAEYDRNGNIKLTRVPKYPVSWPLKKGEEINNQKLWLSSLKSGQKVALVLSVIEQDLSVFDPDDLIGSAKLVIKNNHGKLDVNWTMPNTDKKPSSLTNRAPLTKQYTLSGDEGKYSLLLKVNSKKQETEKIKPTKLKVNKST